MSEEINEVKAVKRDEVARYLEAFLGISRFKDYCPNGLQVEGQPVIRRIVTGVTASQALLDKAVALQADTVLVHHGYFWKGEDYRLTGVRRQRIKTLLANDINLFGYHLPLDAHPELGNNAQLAKLFGWQPQGYFGDQAIGWIGQLENPQTVDMLSRQCLDILQRQPLVITDNPAQVINRIAWCSGGGDSYFEAAISEGVDAFFSGEISEPAVHLSRESGIPYFAAGHHATERYGIKALGEHLVQAFGIECTFVDIDNPA